MIYELFVYWIPGGFLVSITCLLGWLVYLAVKGDSIKDKSYIRMVIDYFKDFLK